MELFISSTRIIHIIFGVIALLSGIVAVIAPKGRKTHRKAGQIYVAAMTGIFGTAVFLAFQSGSFLLAVAIFSYCLTAAGFRSARNLRRKTLRPALADIVLMIATGMVGIGLVSIGLFSGTIPFIVFGGVCLFLAALDIRLFTTTTQKILWLPRHIGYMGGACISTITAALINNVHGLPPIIVWLLPTVIGTPLIITAIRRVIPRRAVAIMLLLFAGSIVASAQPYVDGRETRHRFAQMYVGADAFYIPSGGDTFFDGIHRKFPSVTAPRLTIGGYHFWGTAIFLSIFRLAH